MNSVVQCGVTLLLVFVPLCSCLTHCHLHSILYSGMLQPSAGTAFIHGKDIRTQMTAIRQSLGICPQFDILWPDITVKEHLVLYAVIKGSHWKEAEGVASAAAAEVCGSLNTRC